jgi:hypothetical protein
MLAVDRILSMKIVVRSCGFMILIQNKNCKFHMEKHPNKYIKVRTRSWRGVLDTTLCDKVCQ